MASISFGPSSGRRGSRTPTRRSRSSPKARAVVHRQPSIERARDAGIEGAVGALEEVAEPLAPSLTTMAHHVGGSTGSAPGQGPYFFRYTFTPTFSSRSGTATLPSVEATMMVLPD